MKTMDRELLNELLDLDVDGQLGASEKARLVERLEADQGLRTERRGLAALHTLFRESVIPVRPEFCRQVMAALPAPAWANAAQPGRVPAWALPLAMMLALGVASALVLGLAAPIAESPLFGTGLAVFDFFQVTALTGAGLIAASWRGFGLGLEELIASSGLSLAAMAVFLLFLNLLFISMLRRRPTDIMPILERSAAGTEGTENGGQS